VRATVSSAKPLDMVTETEIQRALRAAHGQEGADEDRGDPTLIGGVVAQVGDLVLDGSLRTRLASVGNRILLN
jgi:F-type H+-transporting ATPase subunit delta